MEFQELEKMQDSHTDLLHHIAEKHDQADYTALAVVLVGADIVLSTKVYFWLTWLWEAKYSDGVSNEVIEIFITLDEDSQTQLLEEMMKQFSNKDAVKNAVREEYSKAFEKLSTSMSKIDRESIIIRRRQFYLNYLTKNTLKTKKIYAAQLKALKNGEVKVSDFLNEIYAENHRYINRDLARLVRKKLNSPGTLSVAGHESIVSASNQSGQAITGAQETVLGSSAIDMANVTIVDNVVEKSAGKGFLTLGKDLMTTVLCELPKLILRKIASYIFSPTVIITVLLLISIGIYMVGTVVFEFQRAHKNMSFWEALDLVLFGEK